MQGRRSCDSRLNIHCLCHSLLNSGTPFEVVILPAEGFTLMLGFDGDHKRMGFIDFHVTAQEITLNIEINVINNITQAGQFNVQIYRLWIDRLACFGEPNAKFWWNARFEN